MTWFEAVIASDPPSLKYISRRLRLSYNNAGDPQPQQKETVISVESDDPFARSWLQSIRPGEKIQILPRAKYLRWVNFVHEVQLEVWWDLKTPQALVPTEDLVLLRRNSSKPTYAPLDESRREIRLLQVLSGGEEDPLRCHMFHTSISNLGDNMPYTALSYCWGERNELATIQLSYSAKETSATEPREWIDFLVQKNLYVALKHIRHREGPARVIWADAVCIDQENPRERSQQVAMMRDIYHLATDVCIWLGEKSGATVSMCENIQLFIDAYNSDPGHFLKSANGHLESPHGKEHFGSVKYGEVGSIFFHAWFSRVWVLQEVFNAKIATVQIGDVSLPWDIVICIGNCTTRALRRAPMGTMTIPGIFLSMFDIRTENDNMFVVKRHEEDLLALLIGSLDLDATEPRDKIFAVLSLHPDRDLLHLSEETRPDYEKETSQVFSDFTRWWIRTYQSLRILSTIHANIHRTWEKTTLEPSSSLPTDRPSWSLWHTGSTLHGNATLGYAPDNSYKASASSATTMRLLASPSPPNILLLKGIKLGAITDIQIYPWGRNDKLDSPRMNTAFEKLFDPMGVAKTWTPDGATSLTTSQENEVLMNDHLIAHQQFAIENDGAVPCLSRCLLSGMGVTWEELSGLCPHTAQVGDVIVVLVGGDVPYLVRRLEADGPRGDGGSVYGFVGECFVEGYMFGRAVTEWRDGRLKMEEFTLM